MNGRKTIPEIVRFVQLIDVGSPTDCWPWKGACFEGGYGRFVRSADGGSKYAIASRVSYELLIGPFDAGLDVLHHCDNPQCVNPNHLFLGTAADNARDMVSKGRDANSGKTHCINGHEYTPENTYVRHRAGKIWRGCKICRNAASRRLRLKDQAHHPDSEAGRDIGPNEDRNLRVKLTVVGGKAAA